MRTRVKICGITNRDDLLASVAAGADAIGLNMYAKSPRYVVPDVAAALAQETPPLVTIVGLFADHGRDEVRTICSKVSFDLLQFHGDETAAFCRGFERRFIKVLRVAPDMNLALAAAAYPGSTGVLLDAWVDGLYGGSGVQLDWSRLATLDVPVILAGGLTPDNVGEAIRIVRPYAVDVSSGVESSPGKKDPAKIEAFIAAVRAADEVQR